MPAAMADPISPAADMTDECRIQERLNGGADFGTGNSEEPKEKEAVWQWDAIRTVAQPLVVSGMEFTADSAGPAAETRPNTARRGTPPPPAVPPAAKPKDSRVRLIGGFGNHRINDGGIRPANPGDPLPWERWGRPGSG
jgi:hypothetical protein